MAIEVKAIDISNQELSAQQWAETTTGIYMNMLGACYYDEKTAQYKLPPIKYSDVNLEGEKIKFGNGVELDVMFSCLASEYKNKQEVYDLWWQKAKEIVEDYKKQLQFDDYAKSNNVSLKKLRQTGQLLEKDELNNEHTKN